MTRSLWKGLFLTNEFIQLKKKKYILKNRNAICLPRCNNKLLHIYTGKQYIPIRFNKVEVIGHKIGEFSFTKKKCIKVKKEKKNFKLKK